MFEHRLGSLLSKTLGEVRALPYPEFRSWQLFHMIEPWGWGNDEYRTAVLASLIYNVNRGKAKAKEVKDFMRDIPKEIFDELTNLQKTEEFQELPLEKRREIVLRQVKKDFGIK